MKVWILFSVGILLALSQSAYSVDIHNTYKWNRKNVNKNNGKVDRDPWYEWWYYKVVDPKTSKSFFFVYGIVNPWDDAGTMKGTRSYVGMGDFKNKLNLEEHFPISNFSSSYDKTFVAIDSNMATDKKIYGSIIDKSGKIAKWDVDVTKKWSFNATGWATGKMITNIEWYPAQADALCNGTITVGAEVTKLTDAPCYQDRNWGHSFPKWWTWIVSNHFEGHSETALAIGGGKPQFFGKVEPIEGVAIGLKHKGVEYHFRPNDLDLVRVNIKFGKWEVLGLNRKYKIEIVASAPKDQFMDLEFVTPEGKVFHDYETLTGEIKVKLYKRPRYLIGKWELIDTLTTKYGGIEYGSDKDYGLTSLLNENIELFSNF
ncbi:MAG: hypothetical protein HOE90_05550 [Bacteriovoracaceae bacterium]|jgi:hypothetical protein|nr:hypothetical protein [Bacteriovoracaceae bacterium]